MYEVDKYCARCEFYSQKVFVGAEENIEEEKGKCFLNYTQVGSSYWVRGCWVCPGFSKEEL